MVFHQEPTHYEKTVLSDLQGGWENLRDAVVNECARLDCSQLLFQVDEGMSWESVRNLERMRSTLILIQSMAQQMAVSEEVMQWIEYVRSALSEIVGEIKQGKTL